MRTDLDSNDVQDAFLTVLANDPVLIDLLGPDGFEMEDTGGVKTGKSRSIAATMIAEGTTDGGTGAGTVVETYQIGIIIYVADKTRSAKKKRELVTMASIIKKTISKLGYRTDPDKTRNAWYKSDFAQPIHTRYRKFDNHQQAIIVVVLYGRRRVN